MAALIAVIHCMYLVLPSANFSSLWSSSILTYQCTSERAGNPTSPNKHSGGWKAAPLLGCPCFCCSCFWLNLELITNDSEFHSRRGEREMSRRALIQHQGPACCLEPLAASLVAFPCWETEAPWETGELPRPRTGALIQSTQMHFALFSFPLIWIIKAVWQHDD